MRQTYLRWLRGLAGIIVMLFLGAMYAWSYFKVALGEAYPTWSQTQVTLNFTIMMSAFCIGGLLAGSILSNLRKSLQLIISAVLVAVGFFGASLLPEVSNTALIQLYVCYGILNGLGTGIAYNAVLSGIQPWFPDCPGLISGALLMGMGFGSLILGNVAAVLVPALGLSATFRVFSIAMLLVLLAGSVVLRLPDERDTLPPPKERKNTAVKTSALELTSLQMLSRPTFWLYFIWNICMSAGGMLVINSASSITVYYGLAAVIGLLVSVFNGLGRLIVGFSMDGLGWKKTMYLSNAVLLLSGVLLCAGDKYFSGSIVLIGMLIMGICYGGGITVTAALIRELYGNQHYASNFSICTLCLIPASIIGPIISAALQDASGGGYWSTFVMVIVLGVITMAMNLFIKKP